MPPTRFTGRAGVGRQIVGAGGKASRQEGLRVPSVPGADLRGRDGKRVVRAEATAKILDLIGYLIQRQIGGRDRIGAGP